jgi:hypothetical protein
MVQPQPLPPMTQAELDARLTESLRELLADSPAETIDSTYERIIEHYYAWVDMKIANNALPPIGAGGMYSEPMKVEMYFAEVVGYREEVKPDTAKRTLYALQKLANREREGLAEKWELKSSKRIEEALKAQARRYYERQRNINIDPHHNLPTNTLSAEEWLNCIRCALANADHCNWQAFTMCFNGSEQMMCRFASMKKFHICDMSTITTHGPCHQGEFDREMLSLVYRKGDFHKERQISDRVVGAWRHLFFEMCFTGCAAMSLFVRLFNGDLLDDNSMKRKESVVKRKESVVKKREHSNSRHTLIACFNRSWRVGLQAGFISHHRNHLLCLHQHPVPVDDPDGKGLHQHVPEQQQQQHNNEQQQQHNLFVHHHHRCHHHHRHPVKCLLYLMSCLLLFVECCRNTIRSGLMSMLVITVFEADGTRS